VAEPTRFLLAAVALVAGGCDQRPDPDLLDSIPVWETTVDQVYNVADHLGLGSGPIDDVGIGPDLELYIPARGGTAVGVVELGAGVTREVGQAGAGPGEFGLVSLVSVDSRGHVQVWDAQGRRVSVFDATGEFLESVPMQTSLAAGPIGEGTRLEHRSEWLEPTGERSRQTFLSRTRGGEERELFDTGELSGTTIRLAAGAGREVQIANPWAAMPHLDFSSSGDGAVIAFPETPGPNGAPVTVLRVHAEGTVEQTVVLPSIRATESVLDDYIAFALDWTSEESGITEDLLRESLMRGSYGSSNRTPTDPRSCLD